MERPYWCMTPDEMATWDAAHRHAEEVREREPEEGREGMSSTSLERETVDLAENIYVLAGRELARQYAKWGDQNHDPTYWLGILGEEFGEVCKAVIERREPDDVIRELVQVIAVAIRMAERITRTT